MSWRAGLLTVMMAAGCLGCATARPFDSLALKNTRPASLLLVVRPPGPFRTRSNLGVCPQGGACLVAVQGLLPYLAAQHVRDFEDGKSLQKSAKLSDPAIEIGGDLRDELADRLGVKASTVILPPVEESTEESSSDLPADPTGGYSADLVLIIRTRAWSMLPRGVKGSNSPLYYTSRVVFELVDTRGEQRRLASGVCKTGTGEHQSQFRYDDLVEAGAVRLHDRMERAVANCTDQFMQILFGPPAASLPPIRN